MFSHSKVCMKIRGNSLDRKDFLGKSDPFLIFLGNKGENWEQVYKTDYIYQDLNPVFDPVELSLQQLTNGDLEKPFKIQCFDWNTNRRYEMIGEAKVKESFYFNFISIFLIFINFISIFLKNKKKKVSVSDVLKKKDAFLINPEKISQNNYNNSGTLIFSESYTTNQFSAVSYFKGGLKLNLILGIDFSSYNGLYSSNYSLHYDNGSNEYIECNFIINFV